MIRGPVVLSQEPGGSDQQSTAPTSFGDIRACQIGHARFAVIAGQYGRVTASKWMHSGELRMISRQALI